MSAPAANQSVEAEPANSVPAPLEAVEHEIVIDKARSTVAPAPTLTPAAAPADDHRIVNRSPSPAITIHTDNDNAPNSRVSLLHGIEAAAAQVSPARPASIRLAGRPLAPTPVGLSHSLPRPLQQQPPLPPGQHHWRIPPTQQQFYPPPSPQQHHQQYQYQQQQWHPPIPNSAAPVVYYPSHPGQPFLMDSCPRCGLIAGQPFEPIHQQTLPVRPQSPKKPLPPPRAVPEATARYDPSRYDLSITGGPRPPPPRPAAMRPPPKVVPTAPRLSSQPSQPPQPAGAVSAHGPPPPGHPNSHLWIPPPGYAGPLPPHIQPQPQSRDFTFTQPPPSLPPTTHVPTSASAPASASPSITGETPTDSQDTTPPRKAAPTPCNTEPDIYYGGGDTGRRVKRRITSTTKPYKRRLTRDERLNILLMRRLGYKHEETARYLGVTYAAVKYTVTAGTADVLHKNAGRKVHFPVHKEQDIVDFVIDYKRRDKLAGVDKRHRNRRIMTPLTYKIIQDEVLMDRETGKIPPELKVSEDAIKAILNKNGLWLRTRYPTSKIPEARERGKRHWQEKVEKEKVKRAAEAAVIGDGGGRGEGLSDSSPIVEIESDREDGDEDTGTDTDGQGDEDVDMRDAYSGTESIVTNDEEGNDDQRDDMQIESRLRPALA